MTSAAPFPVPTPPTAAPTLAPGAVLIVGGGIVGLTTAALLAQRGVAVVLVERRMALSPRLRAKFFYARTLEIYRSLGLEAAIRAASPATEGTEAAVVESLAGPEIRRWQLPTVARNDDSPCQPSTIKQYDLETLVKARASELGADLRFGQQVVGLAVQAGDVTVTIRPAAGAEYQLRAAYVVGCDGARSFVRQQLGIATAGLGDLVYSLGISVRADISAALRGRPLAFAYAQQPGGSAYLSWSSDLTSVAISVPYDPRDPAAEARFTPARCHQLASDCLGLAPAEVEVLETYPWRIAAWVAERYRQGRVLLAGDAAHSTPPLGGFGANTGIHDAHNLALKLAAVLAGEAPASLLDCYEPERRPVGQLVVAQATARLSGRPDVQLPAEALEPLLEEAALTMGYRYHIGGPYATPVPNPLALPPRQLHAEPGTRAPHVAVELAGEALSTLDLFGNDLVVLAGAEAADWADQATACLAALGRRARGYVVGRDLRDPTGTFLVRYGLSSRGVVLVRADGFVVWKSPAAPAFSQAAFVHLLEQARELQELAGPAHPAQSRLAETTT